VFDGIPAARYTRLVRSPLHEAFFGLEDVRSRTAGVGHDPLQLTCERGLRSQVGHA
jgi:hypothetical protein